MTRIPGPAPSRDMLPGPRASGRMELSFDLEVVTPVLGGAPVLRETDGVDVIRAPSVRGHLRFWWRAIYAQRFEGDSHALYNAESCLWGGPATKETSGQIGRSKVELRVEVLRRGQVDRYEPERITRRDSPQVVQAKNGRNYALFPARGQRTGPRAAQVRKPGTRFRLTLRFPDERRFEVSDALLAWVLFGGYGGRTRRGLGSLSVVTAPEGWLRLPEYPSINAIRELFHHEGLFSGPDVHRGQTPLLIGARMFRSFETFEAEAAWGTALGWLYEFRQGSGSSDAARRPPHGADLGRPSISNWPEADKVRVLSEAKQYPWAHAPRHSKVPAWPRAGFGLPIVGQFQGKNRDKVPWAQQQPPRSEPDDFRIGWRSESGSVRERLASPVILKPLALADGTFSPLALWLNRAHPKGQVILQRADGNVVPGSAADFEQFLAPGDDIYFKALEDQHSLEDAFFAWLDANARGNKPQNRRRR